jgi:hypothetical protein
MLLESKPKLTVYKKKKPKLTYLEYISSSMTGITLKKSAT